MAGKKKGPGSDRGFSRREVARPDGLDLTPLEARFCEEFLLDMNVRLAAERAGYAIASARRAGELALSRPAVQAEVARLMRERSERCLVGSDQVLLELAAVAFSDIGDVAEWSGTEVKVKDSTKISRESRKGIAEVSSVFSSQGDRGVKVRLWDKPKALELLMKHLGMIQPKRLEVSGPGGGPVVTQQAPQDPNRWAQVLAILSQAAPRVLDGLDPAGPRRQLTEVSNGSR